MANLDAIFSGMADNFNVDAAKGLDLTIQFDLSGDGGGQWAGVINDGKFNVNKGGVDNADATLKMDADDFADMSNGTLNPMAAFMSGKIKVDGDLNTIMKFQQLVGL